MYRHLSEGAAKVLYKNLDARIAFVKGNEWTVEHTKLMELNTWVKERIVGPTMNRADGLIVHSEPFNGKTMSLKFTRKLNGPTFQEDSEHPKHPVVYFSAKAEMKLLDLRTAILRDILPPAMVRVTDAAVKKQLNVILPAVGARVLLIDEFQDIMIGTNQRNAYLQLIKSLSNDFNLHILGAGLSILKDLLRNEEQLRTRFEPDEFPLWLINEEDEESVRVYKQLIQGIVCNMPFPEPSTLLEDDGINTILMMNQEGVLGQICRTITDGAIFALKEDAKQLTEEHVSKAQKQRLKGPLRQSNLS